MSFIQVQNLSFSFGGIEVFRDLSLTIERGRFCGLAGPNGVGKSTLLKLIGGHLRPSAGSIQIESLTDVSKTVAYLPQESVSVFGYTSSEIVMMARYCRKKRLFFEEEEDFKVVQEAMRWTSTEHLAPRPITHLSGGEKQRVYLARAIAQETPLLLLDEPVSQLDLKHQVLICEVLKRLQSQQNKTIVMATHDLNTASLYCDWMILMGIGGRLISGPVDEVLTKENIEGIYGIECNIYESQGVRFFGPKAAKAERFPDENNGKSL